MSAPSDLSPLAETLHATSVAFETQGILILGPSGAGKSQLALQLIAMDAVLISDDLTVVAPSADGWPEVRGTGRMGGVIEARGVGLLRVPHRPAAPLRLVVDLGETEIERLPAPRVRLIAGEAIACLHRVDTPAFAASIRAMVLGGRVD